MPCRSAGPPAGFPPGGPGGPPDRGGKRGLFLVLAVIVVLAAGGGAYALATTLGKHSTAQPPAQPATSAPGSPTAVKSQQASAPATSASTSPAPSPTLSLVAIPTTLNTHGVGPQVETLLSHYFHGINSHGYPEYAGTLTAEQQAKQTQSQFNAGYSSTTDSGMTLTACPTTARGLAATVTFTSRQAPRTRRR